jgi:phage tail-like protein
MAVLNNREARDGLTGTKAGDPLVSFAFKVFIDGISVAQFSSVDGLSYEAEMIEYRESHDPNTVHFRQGRRKASRVTLKRGVLVGSGTNELFNWIRQIENGGTVVSHNVEITVGHYGYGTFDNAFDETGGSDKKTWCLENCRPVKWSLGALEGTSNGALLESLELAVERIYQ